MIKAPHEKLVSFSDIIVPFAKSVEIQVLLMLQILHLFRMKKCFAASGFTKADESRTESFWINGKKRLSLVHNLNQ